jgi:hypothetical protein
MPLDQSSIPADPKAAQGLPGSGQTPPITSIAALLAALPGAPAQAGPATPANAGPGPARMNFAQFLTQEAAPAAGSVKVPAAPGSLPLPAAAARGKDGKLSHASSLPVSTATPAAASPPGSHLSAAVSTPEPAPATPPLSAAWQPPAPLAAIMMEAGTGDASGGKSLAAAPAGRTSAGPVGTADTRPPGPETQNPGAKTPGIAASAALSAAPLKIPSAPPPPSSSGQQERGAKIAAAVSQTSAPVGSGENSSEKKSLDSDNQRDSSYAADIGIGSAQSMPAMATATANHPPPTFGADLPGAVSTQTLSTPSLVSQTLEPGRAAGPGIEASPDVRAAHAVDTVVALVDAQTTRAQGAASAVKINFNFNGDDLAVRIQVSNGSVHTQFRTDSPELRDAISAQWQSVASTPTGRGMNFLQPSFSGANGSPDAALTFDGGNASRRQDSPESQGRTPSWASSDFEPDSSLEPAPAPTPAALSTARHLHTFA